MKRLLLIVFLLIIIPIVKANTIIQDYKVEIVIDKDDIFKVKETFKTDDIDNIRFKRVIGSNNYEYDYDTNIVNFKVDNRKDIFYIYFSLKEDSEYYLEYKYKNNKIKKGNIDYYTYKPLFYNYSSNEIECNSFNLIVTIDDGRKDDVSFINQSNDSINISQDGNVIVSNADNINFSSISFKVGKKVIKRYFNFKKIIGVDNLNNIMLCSFLIQVVLLIFIIVFYNNKEVNKTMKVIGIIVVLIDLLIYSYPIILLTNLSYPFLPKDIETIIFGFAKLLLILSILLVFLISLKLEFNNSMNICGVICIISWLGILIMVPAIGDILIILYLIIGWIISYFIMTPVTGGTIEVRRISHGY